jgi:DNA-3-methyladenine glycosylase I
VVERVDDRRRTALKHADGRFRCAWCGTDPLYVRYHDTEWGVPVHDDDRLFEMLCLEGAQAGLSWITVLRKREHYRRVFDGFDAEKMARYTPRKQAELLEDPGIVRNRLKVRGFVTNARAFLELRESGRPLAELVWAHRPGRPAAPLPRRHPGLDARERRARQGTEAARLHVRRLDDLLRLHAGGRHRRRPPGALLRGDPPLSRRAARPASA